MVIPDVYVMNVTGYEIKFQIEEKPPIIMTIEPPAVKKPSLGLAPDLFWLTLPLPKTFNLSFKPYHLNRVPVEPSTQFEISYFCIHFSLISL